MVILIRHKQVAALLRSFSENMSDKVHVVALFLPVLDTETVVCVQQQSQMVHYGIKEVWEVMQEELVAFLRIYLAASNPTPTSLSTSSESIPRVNLLCPILISF